MDDILPYLQSKSPVQVTGAVSALYFMRPQYNWSAHPMIPQRIENAVFDAVPHIRSLKNPEALHALTLFCGTVKTARSRALLWELAANPSQREQALTCLCWIADPQDLPRLGALLLEPESTIENLPYMLQHNFGKQAIPYLRKAAQSAQSQSMREQCARRVSELEQDH